MSKKFTASFLKNLRHNGKNQIIRDSNTVGLAIKVGAKTKTFEFYYKTNGKLKRITIGRYPSISLVEAGKQVADHRILLDKRLPLRHQDKSNLTVQQLYNEWSKVKSRTIKDSYKHIDGLMNNHILPSLAEYKLTDLTTSILLKPVEKRVSQGKTGVATITFSRLKEMLNYAVIKGYLPVNPINLVTLKSLGLKRTNENKRS